MRLRYDTVSDSAVASSWRRLEEGPEPRLQHGVAAGWLHRRGLGRRGGPRRALRRHAAGEPHVPSLSPILPTPRHPTRTDPPTRYQRRPLTRLGGCAVNKIHASSPDGTTLLQVAKGIYARGGWPRFWHAWQPVSCVVATEKFVSADLRVCVGRLWPSAAQGACVWVARAGHVRLLLHPARALRLGLRYRPHPPPPAAGWRVGVDDAGGGAAGGSAGFWPNLCIGYLADLLRLPFTYPVELACVAAQVTTQPPNPSSAFRPPDPCPWSPDLLAG